MNEGVSQKAQKAITGQCQIRKGKSVGEGFAKFWEISALGQN